MLGFRPIGWQFQYRLQRFSGNHFWHLEGNYEDEIRLFSSWIEHDRRRILLLWVSHSTRAFGRKRSQRVHTRPRARRVPFDSRKLALPSQTSDLLLQRRELCLLRRSHQAVRRQVQSSSEAHEPPIRRLDGSGCPSHNTLRRHLLVSRRLQVAQWEAQDFI